MYNKIDELVTSSKVYFFEVCDVRVNFLKQMLCPDNTENMLLIKCYFHHLEPFLIKKQKNKKLLRNDE